MSSYETRRDLEQVGDAEVTSVSPEALLLGARSHDEQPRSDTADDAAADRRERPEHVLMALLPYQPPGRARAAFRPPFERGEPLDVDARRAHLDPRAVDSLEHERVSRTLGRGEEQVGLLDRRAAVGAAAEVAICVEERDRLPDREDEPEPSSRRSAAG